MASKPCDACKTATSTIYCQADSAFLCVSCDTEIHAANKLASRHARVLVCEVCEQAPAHVTCKADAASLCVACDRDIHSANPLARRHERVPISPFYHSVPPPATVLPSAKHEGTNLFLLDEACFSDEEEAEADSWLLPTPNSNPVNLNAFTTSKLADLFGDVEPYLDLGFVDPKVEEDDDGNQEQNSTGTDGVVPVQSTNFSSVNPIGGYEMDLCSPGVTSKGGAFMSYGLNSAPSLSQHSVSISSAEACVVPDGEISNPYGSQAVIPAVPLSGVDREARVMRYREKRKNRKFEKTIRYASRKAYAETRPRIKGRFAKRTDQDIDLERPNLFGFGVVPSFYSM